MIDELVTIRDSGSLRRHRVACKQPNGQYALADPETGVMTVSSIAEHRLEPLPSKPKPVEDSPYLEVLGFKVSEDEATEWYVFLMLQAASIFGNTPKDSKATREEIERLMVARGETPEGPVVSAALAHFDESTKWYDECPEY